MLDGKSSDGASSGGGYSKPAESGFSSGGNEGDWFSTVTIGVSL